MVDSIGYSQRCYPKILKRYKSRKIRESLEIKRLKCSSSKSYTNRNYGNLVNTNYSERYKRYKSRKIREPLEIERLKFGSSKYHINRDDGNLVKTNT